MEVRLRGRERLFTINRPTWTRCVFVGLRSRPRRSAFINLNISRLSPFTQFRTFVIAILIRCSLQFVNPFNRRTTRQRRTRFAWSALPIMEIRRGRWWRRFVMSRPTWASRAFL
jgi:hypothetical protein